MEGEGARSLREAQASVVSSSSARSAMAFECFRISAVKRISHITFTPSSESPTASATMPKPDTNVPCGGIPTRSRSSMTNWI